MTLTSKCGKKKPSWQDPQRLLQVLLSNNKSYMLFSEAYGWFFLYYSAYTLAVNMNRCFASWLQL